ncbi:Toxin-antitoxin system, toxin component, Fic family [Desulfosarcina cetonica]|uniref:Fic family protein n=1 Tax=Desulfosarcina cetonica TaxID=90730 RepID=UPI0006CFAE53|nr:Fic family protein [Desulfosarcina cetonica]VTR65484.1 Toxin-antitoxin system, toxin component, Fic family [Desulfosarcina cetonica]
MLTFLKNLDNDLKKALLIQLRNLWTHTSTAIEGNTLTLGETAFVIEEGLTIAGKPLKDHQEVVGHARAIDLVYACLEQGRTFAEADLFALHRAVQTEVVVDVYKPVGGWKKEPNSTVGVVNGKQVIFDYAPPVDVPALMAEWFRLFAEQCRTIVQGDWQQALNAYAHLHIAFVRIHPFFDDNGRLARLVANFPVLKAGLPPIIIPREQRKAYIDALSEYHHAVGQIRASDNLVPQSDKLEPFIEFCRQSWHASIELVEEAQKKQQSRRE